MEPTITISLNDYNELLRIKEEYDKKNFFAQITLSIGRNYTPHIYKKFYYENDENVPEKIKMLEQVLSDSLEIIKTDIKEAKKNLKEDETLHINTYNVFDKIKKLWKTIIKY